MASADILPFPQTFAAVFPLSFPAEDRDPEASEVSLVNRLHRFLEIHELLEAFLDEMRAHFPVTGVGYTAHGGGEVFLAGRKGRRVQCATLHCAGEPLGQIEIHVGRDIGTGTARLLAPLAQPLRNALLYHRAKLLARRDSLSGLGNRMALESAIATEVARAQRFGETFTMLIVDIDHFKRINDALGHSSGDRVIRAVSAELADCLRPYDQAFRYGGEEFVVLLSQTGINRGMRIAERIRRRIGARCHVEGERGRKVTVSIGIAEFQREETVSELFDRADRALYRAKGEGRNRTIAAGD
jgi:diguanylate cyclase (GGDEF)-like protein